VTLVANDPKRTLAEPRHLGDFLPRETSAAKRGIAHQGNEAGIALIKGVMASRGARFLCLVAKFLIHCEPYNASMSAAGVKVTRELRNG
jgi:hypothetical protein